MTSHGNHFEAIWSFGKFIDFKSDSTATIDLFVKNISTRRNFVEISKPYYRHEILTQVGPVAKGIARAKLAQDHRSTLTNLSLLITITLSRPIFLTIASGQLTTCLHPPPAIID